MSERYEGFFNSFDQTEFFYQTWKPETPKGTIVIVHGLAEHSECYNEFAKELTPDNWQITAIDLRGHGKSSGKRGYVNDFYDMVKDVHLFLDLVRHTIHKDGPLILFGHSMGGLLALRTVLTQQELGISALCLSSPALGIDKEVPKIKEKLAEFAGEWAPKLTLANEIKYSELIRDHELQKAYDRDPLRHDKISPRLYLGMKEAMEKSAEEASALSLPLLMQLAGKEMIVSTPASEHFFAIAGSAKKKIHIYNDSYHEIFNDLDRLEVFSDLKNFINSL
jgi:alpha-beta hydrolase superfamily lysophospholipase